MYTVLAIEPSLQASDSLLLLQEDLGDALEPMGWSVHWTAAERLRIPLLTLENLSPDLLLEFRTSLRRIAGTSAPFVFRLSAIRLVEHGGRPNALAACVGDGAEPLSQLAERTHAAANASGLSMGSTLWQPALRLGRVHASPEAPALHSTLEAFSAHLSGETFCDELALVREEASPSGLRSTVIERITLGAAQGRLRTPGIGG